MDETYRQLIDTFGKGWERSDVDQICSVFAPDAVFVETPFSRKETGIGAIRDYWKDLPLTQAEVSFRSGEVFEAVRHRVPLHLPPPPHRGVGGRTRRGVLRNAERQDHRNAHVLAQICRR